MLILVLLIISFVLASIMINVIENLFGFTLLGRTSFHIRIAFTVVLLVIMMNACNDVKNVFNHDSNSNTGNVQFNGRENTANNQADEAIPASEMTLEQRKEDLLDYLNQDMSALGKIEHQLIADLEDLQIKYSSYLDDLNNKCSDKADLVFELPNNSSNLEAEMNKIIENSQKLMEATTEILPKTKELREIHEIYNQAIIQHHWKVSAWNSIVINGDMFAITQINTSQIKMEEALSDYLRKLTTYCKENDVRYKMEERQFAKFILIEDIKRVPATTYFSREAVDPEYNLVIILEPDGTCAIYTPLASYPGFNYNYVDPYSPYVYGYYEIEANGEVAFNIPFDGGSDYSATMIYDEKSLVYNGDELFGPICQYDEFKKEKFIPKAIQHTPANRGENMPDTQKNNLMWPNINQPIPEDMVQELVYNLQPQIAQLCDNLHDTVNVFIDVDTIDIIEESTSFYMIQLCAEFEELVDYEQSKKVKLIDIIWYKDWPYEANSILEINNIQPIDDSSIGSNRRIVL